MSEPSIRELACFFGSLPAQKADLLILPLVKDQDEIPDLWKVALGPAIRPVEILLQSGDFKGELATTALVYGDPSTYSRILFVGFGSPEKLDAEKRRQALAAAARQARDLGVGTAYLLLPEEEEKPAIDLLELAAEAALLGTYRFDAPKKREPEQERCLGRLIFALPEGVDRERAGAALERGRIRAEGVSLARDLANTPANLLTPSHLAEHARKIAEESDLELTVLERADAEKLGMGAYLGVAQGSDQPPKFILLEYGCGRPGAQKIGIIGKGVTFDSGGLSLKPAPKMDEMKYDMCGAAAVLGTMKIVRKLNVPVDVVAAIPAVENMPSGRATKPGDVHTSYSGKTIEILNTDAEGRLILADALTYVARNHKPKAMIDLATLTGAVVIALGHYGAGVLSNDDELADRIAAASAKSGDLSWRLPIWDGFADHLKSPFADVKNTGDANAGGGTIAGAAFLSHFVEELPWAHIDIAGAAWWDKDRPHVPKGGTGFGVRLLVDLLEGFAR